MNHHVKRTFFNELAHAWDGLPAPPDAPTRIAEFCRRAVPATSRTVLDMGCGTGVVLAGLSNSGRRVVEMDIAENMLKQGRAKFGGNAAEFVCGDALHLPFRPGAFDAVVCFGVLPHIEPVGPALQAFAEVLSPGGVMSVGHLMGSKELNAFHAGLSPAVSGDRLLHTDELTGMLAELGLETVVAEERPDWYFVQCRRR